MADSQKVVDIDRRRYQDTVDALRHLLEQAEAGRIRGLAYVVEYTERHAVGSTGNYRRKPASAIGPALDLVDALRALPNT